MEGKLPLLSTENTEFQTKGTDEKNSQMCLYGGDANQRFRLNIDGIIGGNTTTRGERSPASVATHLPFVLKGN